MSFKQPPPPKKKNNNNNKIPKKQQQKATNLISNKATSNLPHRNILKIRIYVENVFQLTLMINLILLFLNPQTAVANPKNVLSVYCRCDLPAIRPKCPHVRQIFSIAHTE